MRHGVSHRDGIVSFLSAAATCIEVYSAPEGPLSISAFDYNLLFRLWNMRGNEGAREGEHMLGGDYYYFRFRKAEIRRELEAAFEVEELTGIRNIPARTIAEGLRRLRLGAAGDRFLRYMVDRGHAADFWIECTPVADLVGFFWQAKCRPCRSA